MDLDCGGGRPRGLTARSAGAAYAASAAACCLLAARSQANFVDLHVYRMGGAAGLALAAAAARRGDEALGFTLCAVTGLLVSPISWTHHWVIAIPVLPVAGLAVYRAYRAGNMAVVGLGHAGIMGAAVIGWDRLARNLPGANWLGLSAKVLMHSVAYVLIGLLLLAVAAAYQLHGSPGRAWARQPDRSGMEKRWSPGRT
jgi:hypothetical protein